MLPFVGGERLLVTTADSVSGIPMFHLYAVDVAQHSSEDFGTIPGTPNIVWAEPEKSVLFSRTVNGLTNIWKFTLKDKSLTQATFGTGPDDWPMPDPNGKGLYLINGKSSGLLTAYDVGSKASTDIASENATQPAISHNGKRIMYITIPAKDRTELWVADIGGSNKTKLSTATSLATGSWSPDDARISFTAEEPGKPGKALIVNADGSGQHALNWTGATIQGLIWSSDGKSVFINAIEPGVTGGSVYSESADGGTPEKLFEGCGLTWDMEPSGRYLLGIITAGDKAGIYGYSLAEKKCTPLVPGVVTFGILFARDGKSILYAIPSRKDVTIYRQNWQAGQTVGQPQVAMKLPFAFPLISGGNAYDFTRDLKTVVFARPAGHADLYLISQK
jgi:hypothetical protein